MTAFFFFLIQPWGSHIPSSWMVHAGCVFVAGRWNACVHRLGLGLNSPPKEFWGERVRNHVNSKGKNPLYRRFRGRFDPGTLHHARQRAHHTDDWAIPAHDRIQYRSNTDFSSATRLDRLCWTCHFGLSQQIFRCSSSSSSSAFTAMTASLA